MSATDEEWLARLRAEADETLIALGIPLPPPEPEGLRCAYSGCNRPVPPGRRRYCRDSCGEAVRKARWRAKAR